ncbi:MAG TPA: phosphohydrolase, partial [Bacillota bacterium]|nr:phosphohydrolase [Bacillota bacterium]
MFTFGRIKDKVVAVLSLLARQRKIRRGSAAVLFLLLLTLILSVDFFPNEANLQVGQVSPRTFYADKSIVFEDKNKTAEQRRLAAEKVEKVYVKDPQVIIGVQRDISDVAGTLREVQGDESLDKNAKIEKLKEILPFNLNDADLEKLAESSPDYTQQVENSLKGLIALSMEEGDGITQDSLEEDERDIVNQIIRMSLPQHYENLAISIIELYLRPNAFVDYEMTRQKQEEAMASVAPTMITVKEGEKIIGEGEIVSEEHLVKLQALGLTRTKLPWTSVMGIFLLTVMLTVLVLFYLYQQNREIYEHPGHIYLLGIIVITVLAVGKAIIAINVSQWPEFGAQFGYMVPLAAAGMLIAILLDSRLAVLVVAVMSFMLAIMTDYQLRFGLVGLIGGITGVYSVSKLSQRGDLVRAGFYTSGANVVAIFIVGLVTGTPLGLLISTSL